MERRLRGRQSRLEDAAPATQPPAVGRRAGSTTTASGPTTRTRSSPARNKTLTATITEDVGPRTRRSSRPRSAAALPNTASVTTNVKTRTPIKEGKESSSPRQSTNNLPTTLTTNTSTRAPNKSFVTSSVQSSYSSTSTTTERIEIRSDGGGEINTDSIRKRLADRLRRSLSKTTSNAAGTERTHTPNTNTEDAGSRYSRSASRSVYDDDKFSKASYSDVEEEEEEEARESAFRSFNVTRQSLSPQPNACRKVEAPREFGGWLGVSLLMILIPAMVYYLIWSCAGVRNACAFKRINLTVLLDWSYLSRQVFKSDVISAFFGYQVVMFWLVALLPGRRVHLTRETYKFNALTVALTILLNVGIAEYLKYPVVSFILRHYLRFCIYSCVSAFVAAAWSYWRVDTTLYNVLRQPLNNDYGRSGNFLVDFALGRQLNPKWLGRVDLKQYYYRLSLISALLYAAGYIYQTIQWPASPVASEEGLQYILRYYLRNIGYDAGTIMAASLLVLYLLDAIVFEHHLSSSFELQHEGYGCLLLLRYAVTPYILTAITKYMYEQRVPISCCFAPYGAFALLLLGLGIKRYSCAYKYQYRLNAHNPIFSNIDTIHTYQGSRLLLSGLWGRLRQPNYLGDIIALGALSVPLFLRFAWPPLLLLLLLVLVILHRATRANARNQARYHSSWHRYCAQVRFYVLPKIY
ncbi:lamin-B receptor [Scaptodrosophila lebanonensis]|uniref:Lamin-B receptor n=1 Tax=Drosophila lebanonensis TaxID=7225 RepID=A0A6J2TZY3_DROLE|nr:lamin-B receptor [Scaptodrosophila lebanonensis]